MSWKVYSLNRLVNYQDISKNANGEDLKKIAIIKTKPEISDNLKINNKIYHVGILDLQRKYVGVREISFVDEEDVDETIEEQFTCPYCGYVNQDAFELDDDGECECNGCSSELKYTRQVTIEYIVEPIRRAKIKKRTVTI